MSFSKDVSEFVGLPISISSRNGEDFVGQIDSVEEINEHICKLYCVGSSGSSSEDKTEQKAYTSKKQANKPKKKS